MAAYTAGFMTHVTCRLTVKNRDQLRNLTLSDRVQATFTVSVAAVLIDQLSCLVKVISASLFVII